MTERKFYGSSRESAMRGPECPACWKYRTCERAAENKLCLEFARNAPEDRGMGPSEAWTKGEDDGSL